MSTFDIIVIGAGSGGLNIASFMNAAGFKVLLIDKSDKHIGGDCLNFGCVPSKALIHVAKHIHAAEEAKPFGLKTQKDIDLKKVMDYVKSKQAVIRTHENAAYFRKKGMTVELGTATFVGKRSIKINGKIHSAKRILLATGSRPRALTIPGIEKVNAYNSETIWNMNELPKRLLVIGGGPIGMELGQAFSRLGSKVTIVQRGHDFLPKESPEITKPLLEQLKKEGIQFAFNTTPQEFTKKNEVLVKQKNKTGKITFDAVLVSIGRQLNIEGLDLEKAGIELTEDKRKIKVNEYLQTTNKNVYLCGDIAGSYQFTHAAELHAGVILKNFFSPFKKKLSNENLSWVTYTSPEIATFGLNEETLKERKMPYAKLVLDFADDDRAIVTETTNAKSILFIHKEQILGGSMVAENAGEIYQELILAKTNNIPLKAFFNKIYAYPTASRVNKAIIANHYRKKFTPLAKKILQFLY